ncbi:MAG TPA: arylesterase [Caulobacteraceae bacterium]|nr:arylesterase [Caulobacteraceae bacterium]
MGSAPQIHPIVRREAVLLMLGAALGALLSAPAAVAAQVPTVVLLGDSVTAGYGLPAADALPVQLQAALAKRGRAVKIVPAGVSGDTSADGLARIDFSVPAGTDLCLVELGGNDLLQGADPDQMRQNLEAIVRRLKARGVRAAMIGLKAPPKVGAAYARDFDAAFARAARDTGAPLYADWFAGVADPALRQGDGIHPNAAGVRALAFGLAPFVIKALRSGA